MKCRVCREPAVIEVRRHNAGFCQGCFLTHCRNQVERAIEEHSMIAPGDRVLVAVSGGKDSLALWDILLRLGYSTDGVYIGLGIEGYSEDSGGYAQRFAAERGAQLVEVDLPRDYGYDVKTGAAADHRVPCSACGLSKRHLFDRAALDGGYDVVATGHNLDDEAAVLLGNVLRWDLAYMARQRPVLPGGDGFPRKVKPLIRLGERETAAYCVLSADRLPGRGMPDGGRQPAPRLQGRPQLPSKNAHPVPRQPSTAASSSGAPNWWRTPTRRSGEGLHPCSKCGAPTTSRRGVRLLPAGGAGRRQRAAPGGCAVGDTGSSGGRPFEPGDRVLLFDTKGRRYLVILEKEASSTPTPAPLPHDAILGQEEGSTVRSSRGARYIAVRPTLAEVVLKMPRGAQVIYPKDLGPILVMADIFPGARVLEAGLGSGALSMTLLRAGADVTGYELRDDFADRGRGQRDGLPGRGRARPLPRRGARRLRRHRRKRPRPGAPGPARAVARRQACGGGVAARRHHRFLPTSRSPR